MNSISINPSIIPDERLMGVTGGAMLKPADCGRQADQYEVTPGHVYYYHYTGGGHEAWLHIRILRVAEESKGVLWFTERFAYVEYDNGLTGKLPLDTGDVFLDMSYLNTLRQF